MSDLRHNYLKRTEAERREADTLDAGYSMWRSLARVFGYDDGYDCYTAAGAKADTARVQNTDEAMRQVIDRASRELLEIRDASR